MNIGLSGHALISFRQTGIAHYTLSLYRELFCLDTQDRFFIFNLSNEPLKEQYFPDFENVIEYRVGTRLEKNKDYYTTHKKAFEQSIKKFLHTYEIDVFYIPGPIDHTLPPYDRAYFGSVPVVATIHDLIPALFKQQELFARDGAKGCLEYYKRLLATRHMDRLLAISATTKKDYARLMHVSHRKIVLVYESVYQKYQKKNVDARTKRQLRKKYAIREHLLLYVGGNAWRKNAERLIEALALVPANIRQNATLIFVGKTAKTTEQRWQRLIKENELYDHAKIAGYVTYDELNNLYNMADWMVFPSIYEGFGMPVVEAWKCDVPVMTSNNSSLGEIGKNAAVLVDPFSKEDIARGLTEILTMSDAKRKHYISNGQRRAMHFEGEPIARKILQLLHEEANKSSKKKRCCMFLHRLSGKMDEVYCWVYTWYAKWRCGNKCDDSSMR